jgi:hypothetical protein
LTVSFADDTLRESAPHPRSTPKESIISETPGTFSRDDAVSASLVAIHHLGDGLYNQALVIINGVVNFNEQDGYCTPITGAGSGGSTTFLDPNRYGRGTPEYNEAMLSQRDSEVACLQEAWDWLTGGPQQTPQSVTVVLVGNIGPCIPCQLRIKTFRDMLVSHFGAHVPVEVEVIYDQDDASAKETQRSGIPTTYGYPGLPDSRLADRTLVWRYTVT